MPAATLLRPALTAAPRATRAAPAAMATQPLRLSRAALMPSVATPVAMAILPTEVAMSPKDDRAAFLKLPKASPPVTRSPTRPPMASPTEDARFAIRDCSSCVMSTKDCLSRSSWT